MPSSPILVSLVEDDDGVRESLALLINGALASRCVGKYKTAEAALKGIPQDKPDVVLMDINLPGMSGIECVRQLRARLSKLTIVMLTVCEDDEDIFQALKAGASGYLNKETRADELLRAIEEAHRGGAPMSSNIARRVIEVFHQAGVETQQTDGLSARERQVLDLLAEGYLYKEIADTLKITYETVHSHVRNIYEKLHVHSRGQAVRKYLRGSNPEM